MSDTETLALLRRIARLEDAIFNKPTGVVVQWKCPCCQYNNRWRWHEDSIVRGPILMTCDNCERDVPCRITGSGRVVVPRKAAGKEG